MVEILNAMPTGDDCLKCGNPNKMYWCENCESNQEKGGECVNCRDVDNIDCQVIEDKNYHKECDSEKDKDFDIEGATNEELSLYQDRLWNELQPEIEGTGISSTIEKLLEVERELTLREEQPY